MWQNFNLKFFFSAEKTFWKKLVFEIGWNLSSDLRPRARVQRRQEVLRFPGKRGIMQLIKNVEFIGQLSMENK